MGCGGGKGRGKVLKNIYPGLKECPLCAKQGWGDKQINEMHLILECQAMEGARGLVGLDRRVEWARGQQGGKRGQYAWFWGKEGKVSYSWMLEVCKRVMKLRDIYWEMVLEETAGWAAGQGH